MAEQSEPARLRLATSLEKIASGLLDECPVCLEKPAAEDARILRCCAAIMCRHCIPSCKRTCPFCRCPFQEGRLQRADEGESEYTYTTQDYSACTNYTATNDYKVTRRYESKDYSSTSSYSSGNYSSSSYSSGNYSSTTNYTSKSYTSTTNYTSSNDYSSGSSSSVSDKYSVSGDKYKATSTDYSSIADKYKVAL